MRHPSFTKRNNANVFTNALDRIIDGRLLFFSEKEKGELKYRIFDIIFEKEEIEVSVYDIVQAGMKVIHKDDGFYMNFSRWLNFQLDTQYTEIQVKRFFRLLLKHNKGMDTKESFETIIEQPDIKESIEPTLVETLQHEREDKKQFFLYSDLEYEKLRITDKEPIVFLEQEKIKKMYEATMKILHKMNIKTIQFIAVACISVLFFVVIKIQIDHMVDKALQARTLEEMPQEKPIVKHIPIQIENLYLMEDTVDYHHQITSISEEAHTIEMVDYLALLNNALDSRYQYQPTNKEAVKAYIKERNGLIGEEPYISIIYDTARLYNVNPLLLLAITGQEQHFVQKNDEYAKDIINNPFNIYNSWRKFNTDLEESSKIAARTIVSMVKDKPKNEDTLKWINRRYASDRNWYKGVKFFFEKLEEVGKVETK